MIRIAYKVTNIEQLQEARIEKVDITDAEGVDWRTAKKQLRKHYLDKAAALRKVTEKSYFE